MSRPVAALLERLTPALSIGRMFLVWQIGQRLTGWPPDFIAPLPSAVLAFTVQRASFLLSNLAVTLAEAAGGFAISNLLAIGLAIACVYNRTLERTVMPFALAVRSIPLIVAEADVLVVGGSAGLAASVGARSEGSPGRGLLIDASRDSMDGKQSGML